MTSSSNTIEVLLCSAVRTRTSDGAGGPESDRAAVSRGPSRSGRPAPGSGRKRVVAALGATGYRPQQSQRGGRDGTRCSRVRRYGVEPGHHLVVLRGPVVESHLEQFEPGRRPVPVAAQRHAESTGRTSRTAWPLARNHRCSGSQAARCAALTGVCVG